MIATKYRLEYFRVGISRLQKLEFYKKEDALQELENLKIENAKNPASPPNRSFEVFKIVTETTKIYPEPK